MSEDIKPREIRQEVLDTVIFAERIMRGEFSDQEPDDDSLDPSEVFTGPLLDLNDEQLSESEIAYLKDWMRKRLACDIDSAPIRIRFLSPDELTTVDIIETPFGPEDFPWYFSRWQNDGELPSYIFWPEEMYGVQVQSQGYVEVPTEKRS